MFWQTNNYKIKNYELRKCLVVDANMGMVDPRTRLVPSRTLLRLLLTSKEQTNLLFCMKTEG